MTYLLRGAVVSLGSFFILYVALSALLAVLWNTRALSRVRGSNALFALRVSPFVLSLVGSALIVAPSFMLFENIKGEESVGWFAIASALGGFCSLAVGMFRTASASLAAARFAAAADAALAATSAGPGIFVLGAFRPTLVVTSTARGLLGEKELQAAIRHEQAHIANRDNLKKLFLRSCSLSMLQPLDEAWSRAAEMEADIAAACDERIALDLASALVKVAKYSHQPLPLIATALASTDQSFLATRVDRLLTWHPQVKRAQPAYFYVMLLCAAVVLTASYSPLLNEAHRLTELLVR